MTNFRLHPEAYLVTGMNGSCLHDLRTSRVFRLRDTHARVLALAEKNLSLSETAEAAGLETDAVAQIWQETVDAGCGALLEGPAYVEKVSLMPEWRQRVPFKSPPALQYAFIDLGGECERACSFCDLGPDSLSTPCFRCRPSTQGTSREVRDGILHAAQVLANLRVPRIVVLASPAVDTVLLREVLTSLERHQQFEVTLASEYSLLNRISSADLCSCAVRLRARIEDLDVANWTRIRRIARTGLTIELLLDDKEDSGVTEKMISHLIATNIQTATQRMHPATALAPAPQIVDAECSIETFSIRANVHPCLSSMVTVRLDGTVLTCPQVDEPIGHGFDVIKALSAQRYQELRKLSIDTIEPCRSCRFRYACHDCRAREIRAGAGLHETLSCGRGV